MDINQVLLLLLFVAVAVYVHHKFSVGLKTASFMIEVYDSILSFEWKPTEEIGIRIHASEHKLIASFVDELHSKHKRKIQSRVQFCKVLAREIAHVFPEVDWAETRAEQATEDWLRENAHILRELSDSDKRRYAVHQARMVSLRAHGVGESPELRALMNDLDELMKQTDESDLFKLILIRKKPGGKLPPKLSSRQGARIRGKMQGQLQG